MLCVHLQLNPGVVGLQMIGQASRWHRLCDPSSLELLPWGTFSLSQRGN